MRPAEKNLISFRDNVGSQHFLFQGKKKKKREREKCYREKVFLLITIVRKFRLEEMLKKESMKHK